MEDEDLLARVTDTGSYLRQRLTGLVADHEVALEARGIGLIQGLELSIPGRPLAEAALEQKLMLNFVQGSVMRFLPAFLLERQHVDTAMEIVEPLLAEASSAVASEEPLLAVAR